MANRRPPPSRVRKCVQKPQSRQTPARGCSIATAIEAAPARACPGSIGQHHDEGRLGGVRRVWTRGSHRRPTARWPVLIMGRRRPPPAVGTVSGRPLEMTSSSMQDVVVGRLLGPAVRGRVISQYGRNHPLEIRGAVEQGRCAFSWAIDHAVCRGADRFRRVHRSELRARPRA